VEAAVRAALGDGGGSAEWVEGFAADVLAGLPDESFDLAFSAPPRYPGFIEPTWLEGESRAVLEGVEGESFDLAFGCPPYYSLERYSDDPRDLSTMTPAQFDAAMVANIAEVGRLLRPDSFAVFVTGNVRGRDGVILDMRRCMTEACAAAGLGLINDAILLTPVGSAAARAAKGFKATRVLARIHQEVLVFVKGDRKAAAARAGEVDRRELREVVEDRDE
jgi:hypothetical protein